MKWIKIFEILERNKIELWTDGQSQRMKAGEVQYFSGPKHIVWRLEDRGRSQKLLSESDLQNVSTNLQLDGMDVLHEFGHFCICKCISKEINDFLLEVRDGAHPRFSIATYLEEKLAWETARSAASILDILDANQFEAHSNQRLGTYAKKYSRQNLFVANLLSYFPMTIVSRWLAWKFVS